MAISANVKNAVREAIKSDNESLGKWQKVALTVAGEYSNLAAFETVKADFLNEAIYPAMGDNAVAAIKTELPRKNSTEFKERAAKQPEYEAQWETANRAKRDTKAKGHTYFDRVSEDAFPAEYAAKYGKPEAPPRTLKTRTIEELTALIKAHEKAENGDPQVIAALDKALQLAAKMK